MRHPLPDPEREAHKFFSIPLRHLVYDQIIEIVRFIIDEARRSREFDLYIENGHLEKEELFFLAAINGMGGVTYMRKHIDFDMAREQITGQMWGFFADELRHYRERSMKQGARVLNSYNCHLESVRNRVLHEIYNVPNRALYTT